MSFCKVSPQTSDLFPTASSSPWPNIVAAHGSGRRRRRRKAWSGNSWIICLAPTTMFRDRICWEK
jgi:hypothetical protein